MNLPCIWACPPFLATLCQHTRIAIVEFDSKSLLHLLHDPGSLLPELIGSLHRFWNSGIGISRDTDKGCGQGVCQAILSCHSNPLCYLKQYRICCSKRGGLGGMQKQFTCFLVASSFTCEQWSFALMHMLFDLTPLFATFAYFQVFAQLLGLGLSVLLLKKTDVTGSYESLFGTWLAMVVAHVAFRYISLSKVVFQELNLKRAKVRRSYLPN